MNSAGGKMPKVTSLQRAHTLYGDHPNNNDTITSADTDC